MIPLHGHTCYYFNVFSRRMQDLPGYFPRFSDKKYPFSLRQPFFFSENHFTAAGMCRKGLPPPLWNPLPSHAGLLILSQDKPVKYELHHWIHAKCRMTFLGQELKQCFRISCRYRTALLLSHSVSLQPALSALSASIRYGQHRLLLS